MSRRDRQAQRRTRIRRRPATTRSAPRSNSRRGFRYSAYRTGHFLARPEAPRRRARCHTTTGAKHDSYTLAPRPDAPAVAMEER